MDYETTKKFFLEKKRQLLNEIEDLREEETFKRAVGTNYTKREHMFLRMPVQFLKTTFHTRRDEVCQLASANFCCHSIGSVIEKLDNSVHDSSVEYFVVCCKNIVKTEKGYVLTMFDPYATVKSKPLSSLFGVRENAIVNHMLQIKVIIKKNFSVNQELDIIGMNYTNLFIDGVNKGHRYNKPYYYDSADSIITNDGRTPDHSFIKAKVRTEDYDNLKELESIKGYGACKNACENFARKKIMEGWRGSPDAEENERKGYIFLRSDFCRYALIYKNGLVEVIAMESCGLTDFGESFYDDIEMGITEWTLEDGANSVIDWY